MSEWQNKSNFEINKAVVELINNTDCDGSDFEKFFADARICELENGSFNPCNDASYAWPIISENKISLEYRDHKSLKPVAKRFGSNSHNIADDNVLRAAMIVYLEMNGVKP